MSSLFREKNLQRISSPEQLNAYIRVSTPSVWMLLGAIVILLVGICVWGVFGRMDTKLSVVAVSENGTITAYIREADISDVDPDDEVIVGDAVVSIADIKTSPVIVDDSFTDYMLHVGGLQAGEWVYAVTLDGEFTDGVHSADIVTDSVSPMSFVMN